MTQNVKTTISKKEILSEEMNKIYNEKIKLFSNMITESEDITIIKHKLMMNTIDGFLK